MIVSCLALGFVLLVRLMNMNMSAWACITHYLRTICMTFCRPNTEIMKIGIACNPTLKYIFHFWPLESVAP